MTLVFFLLTFAASWTCFGVAVSAGESLGALRTPIILLGVFAPSYVALALTARTEGISGVRTLLGRVLAWRAAVRWYVFAAGYMGAVKLTVAVVLRLAKGVWPRFGPEAWIVILAAIILSTPAQAGEELGWRGYALPRLALRFGFAGAGLILGVIWAAWHLPLFFLPGADTSGQSFPVYLLQVTALSLAITWLYVHTNGSLLLTMLMHSAINQTKDIVPSAVAGATNVFTLESSVVAWATVAALWICGAYFFARMLKS